MPCRAATGYTVRWISVGPEMAAGKEDRELYLDLAELALVASPLGDAAGGFISRADGPRCTSGWRQ